MKRNKKGQFVKGHKGGGKKRGRKSSTPKKAKHRGKRRGQKPQRCMVCSAPIFGGDKGMGTHMKRRHKGAAAGGKKRKPRKKSLHGGRWVKTKAGRKKSYSAAKVLARYQRMKAAHAKKAAARAAAHAKRTAPGKRKFHPFRVFARYKRLLASKKARAAARQAEEAAEAKSMGGFFSGLGAVAEHRAREQAQYV